MMSRSRRRVRSFAAAALIAAVAAATLPAGMAAVVKPGCVASNLTQQIPAVPDLAAAIAAAQDGDVLQVKGVCGSTSTYVIDKPLTIVGKRTKANGVPTIAIKAPDLRVLDVSGTPTVSLRGVRITGAAGSIDEGGAIRVTAGELVLTSVRIDGITADVESGGAVYVGPAADLVLAGRTRIAGTAAYEGGGVMVANGASMVMRDKASIRSTTAAWGAGVFVGTGSRLQMLDLTSIERAAADEVGGAIFAGGESDVDLTGEARLHHNSTKQRGSAIVSWGRLRLRQEAVVELNDGTAATGKDGYTGSAIEISSYGTVAGELRIGQYARVRGNTAKASGAGVLVLTACGPGAPAVSGTNGRVVGNTPTQVRNAGAACWY